MLQSLSKNHDMLLETRRRDGTWVPTPVNLVVEDDHIYFRTWGDSGKAKRLHNFSEVHVAPSTARGRPTAARLEGEATLLRGDDDEHAASLMNHRYPVRQGVDARLFHHIRPLDTKRYVT